MYECETQAESRCICFCRVKTVHVCLVYECETHKLIHPKWICFCRVKTVLIHLVWEYLFISSHLTQLQASNKPISLTVCYFSQGLRKQDTFAVFKLCNCFLPCFPGLFTELFMGGITWIPLNSLGIWNHRIIEVGGDSGMFLVQSPFQTGSARAAWPSLCPDRFWTSPRT